MPYLRKVWPWICGYFTTLRMTTFLAAWVLLWHYSNRSISNTSCMVLNDTDINFRKQPTQAYINVRKATQNISVINCCKTVTLCNNKTTCFDSRKATVDHKYFQQTNVTPPSLSQHHQVGSISFPNHLCSPPFSAYLGINIGQTSHWHSSYLLDSRLLAHGTSAASQIMSCSLQCLSGYSRPFSNHYTPYQ
jgi:hypothetical protein